MMEGVGFLIKRGKVGQQNSCKLRIKAPCLKCFLLLILATVFYQKLELSLFPSCHPVGRHSRTLVLY